MNFRDELEKSIPINLTLTEKEKAAIRNRVRQPNSPKRQLKPAFISVLFVVILGVFVLSNMESIEKEENATEQLTIDDATKPITEEQKQQYYEQYKKIVEQAMQQKVGINIEVAPIEEFKESDWVVPDLFEKRVQGIVDSHLETEREKITAMSFYATPHETNTIGQTTKSTYIYVTDRMKEIEVSASFETQYSEAHDRQLFVAIDNISSQLAIPKGTWEQTSYKASLIDGGRTYRIRIEGILDYLNISTPKAFTIEFSCNEFGKIE